jgi:hypothetical protein
MTQGSRLRIWRAAAAALGIVFGVREGFAVELGDLTNYVRGSTQGLPLGALPGVRPATCMLATRLSSRASSRS